MHPLPAEPVVTVALVGVTPEPGVPTDGEDPGYSSPGVVGFLVTFALVLACIPLFMSMVRKVRGVQRDDEPAGPDAPGRPDDDAPGRRDDAGPR